MKFPSLKKQTCSSPKITRKTVSDMSDEQLQKLLKSQNNALTAVGTCIALVVSSALFVLLYHGSMAIAMSNLAIAFSFVPLGADPFQKRNLLKTELYRR